MIFVFNLPGVIVLAISLAFSMLLNFYFPHAAESLHYFFYTVPLLIVGYFSELLDLKARLYFISVQMLGALATALGVLNQFGYVWFSVSAVGFLLLAWLFNAMDEQKRWKMAQKKLSDYKLTDEKNPDLREMMLIDALFQNKWIRARNEQIAHNEEVIGHLLTDDAVHLSALERQVVELMHDRVTGRGTVVKWGWFLNYIDEMQQRLAILKERRSIGRLRI